MKTIAQTSVALIAVTTAMAQDSFDLQGHILLAPADASSSGGGGVGDAEAKAKGWTVVDMKKAWKQIYP